MDCFPRNDGEPFSVNYSGWKFLRHVLVLSGADVSEMAGSNDGYPVSARTAMVWAEPEAIAEKERPPPAEGCEDPRQTC
jgi:hypothetical protein